MITVAGTGSQTLQFGGAPHQISINNLDSVNSLNIKINGDPTGQTVLAGEKRGWRINKGIYSVEITTSGMWEISRE